nr:MAG: hypothetical protein [Caudoviricetes sp.]
MEILQKILDLISEFLNQRKQRKEELEKVQALKIEQQRKSQEQLSKRKNETIKPPKKDDFFNDDSW